MKSRGSGRGIREGRYCSVAGRLLRVSGPLRPSQVECDVLWSLLLPYFSQMLTGSCTGLWSRA